MAKKILEPEFAVILEPSANKLIEQVQNKSVVIAHERAYSDVVDMLETRRIQKYKAIATDNRVYNKKVDIIRFIRQSPNDNKHKDKE